MKLGKVEIRKPERANDNQNVLQKFFEQYFFKFM